MYLEYGQTDDGRLIHIDSVPRGVTPLVCPYCGGTLLARKGEILQHHFAHIETTCRDVKRNLDRITLPAYDRFHEWLPGAVMQTFRDYTSKPMWGVTRTGNMLEEYGLLTFNEWRGYSGAYELTKRGKLVLGQLSLNLFIDYQEPLIMERYERLRSRAEAGRGKPNFDTLHTDWLLYVAQMRRILACSLYFLSINGGALYKIGVTTRPIAERVAEIRQDLFPHLGDAQIEVVRTWPHRGNVELYFKYRYAQHQHRLGALTEYFKFDDVKPVRRDLARMKAKVLTELEQHILSGTVQLQSVATTTA